MFFDVKFSTLFNVQRRWKANIDVFLRFFDIEKNVVIALKYRS